MRLASVALALLLAGCTAAPTMHPGQPTAEPSAVATGSPAELSVTPKADAKNLPISTEIGVSLTHGTIQSVVLADSAGKTLKGQMREDQSSWVPDQPLKHSATYTATVTALGDNGATVTETTTFKTMAKPGRRNGVGLYLFENKTYGVAMPVVVEFGRPVPESARASIEKRMFVKTTPHQPGAWSWSSPLQVMYRAENYWLPGTKIEARIALAGHPMGDGRYGDEDRRGIGNISTDKIELIVENSTKQMTVRKNDQVVKTIPVSLGKPSTPSSSGTMVIMDKLVKTVFDTTDEPGGYRIDIEYAQRLTWSGQFIHAAPWSEDDQGKRNVSHGCVNVSMANAKYLFDLTRVGDPVTVRGTEEKIEPANGFTAWSKTWEEHQAGSAL